MIKIVKKGKKIPVYDLHVAENHNFIANGVVVHNCTEIIEPTFTGKTKYIKPRDYTGDIVNRSRVVNFDQTRNELEIMEDGEVAVCLAAGTKVLTQKGYQNIENISDNDRVFIPYDNDVDLNSDPRLESAALIRNGLKPVYEITLNGGSSIQATDNHKFLIKESRDFRLKQNKMVWKELKELQPGDKIMSPENNMVHDHTFVLNSEYLTAGWLLGDGWQLESGTWGVCFGSTETHAMNIVMTQIAKWYENTPISKFGYHKNAFRLTSNNRKTCYQWQTQKKEYIKFLIEKFGFKPAKSIHKIVPNNIWHAEANEKANFLSGLFSADGTAFLERDRPKVSLASSSKQLLGEVQLLLSEFGIKSRLKWNLIKGRNRYQGSLGIGNNDNVLKFKKYIGFNLSPSKQNVLNQTMAEYKIDSSLRDYHTIESIRYLGIRPVYDLNIPNGHHFVANGVVVHNCNLGSINLAKYVTKDGKFDIAKIKRNVPIAVKFLDKVIDRNYYPITEASNSNKKWRPIGLGVMGWQDLLFKLRIPFESDQAATIAANIQEEIYYWALKTSMELAKEHGAHENFKKTHAAQGKLQFDFNSRVSLHNEERWTELKTEIKKHGLRNSLLIAIAPTACQVGTNVIQTESGNKSIYQILTENNIDYKSLENECDQMWLNIKPFNVPTMNGLRETNKIWYNGPQETFKITFEDGNSYEYTGNHKLLVVRNNELIWVEVRNLVEGDDIKQIMHNDGS